MKRRNKFNAKKTTVDGITFASKAEAERYCDLKNLERAGKISRLELQPRFDFIINGVKCGFYKADFAFFADNKRHVIDVKGVRTPVYKLKKRITEALYPGVTITEV